MTPEFSRAVPVDAIAPGGRAIEVVADADERRKLAGRFGWRSLDRLEASATLTVIVGGVAAAGQLRAAVVQACVATGDDIASTIDEAFALRFVAAVPSVADEVELSDDDLDVIEFDGAAVDLGEAVAQTLALALDPFPRVAAADAKLKAAGVLGEGEAGPFAGLKGLL